MYVILGASGNTGNVVAKNLLARGQKVRVVGRNAAHLQPLAAQGAEIFIADATDASALTKAFHKADAAYVMIPPNPTSHEYRAYQDRVSDAIAAAIKNAGVKNVVSLSSFGADKPSGTGPVVGLHDLEQKLNQIEGANVLHLRAGYFMENTLPQVGAIRMVGSMIGPVAPTLKLPMTATRDIGAAAADALLRLGFQGKQTQELHGQRDIDYTEAAAIVGKAIGKPDLRIHSGARQSDSSCDGADGNVRQHGRPDPGNGRRTEQRTHARAGTSFRRQHNAHAVRNLCSRVLRSGVSKTSSSIGSKVVKKTKAKGHADSDAWPLFHVGECNKRAAGFANLHSDAHCLGLGVEIENVFAHFASPARLLVAAKRQSRVKNVVAVDPDRSGAQQCCRAVRFEDILVQTPAARPYTESLAAIYSSSGLSNGIAATTGPNISSCTTFISSLVFTRRWARQSIPCRRASSRRSPPSRLPPYQSRGSRTRAAIAPRRQADP